MLKKLKKIFADVRPEATTENNEKAAVRLQIATCVLLLEIAHSDDHFSDEEQARIVEILKEDFELSDEYAAELLELAHQERRESSDLWRFTSVIVRSYSIEEKERVVETLWKLVYADDRLHFREDHLIHRLSRLLNLSHKQLIDAKKRVMGWK